MMKMNEGKYRVTRFAHDNYIIKLAKKLKNVKIINDTIFYMLQILFNR